MKIVIFTVGCKVNQYESESLAFLFTQQGYTIVSKIEEADICIVNTCTVTHRADYDSRHYLRQIIRKNPNAICIATGCYVQTAYRKLAEIKGIDYLIGNKEKPNLPKLLPYLKKQPTPKILVSKQPTTLDTLICLPPAASIKRTRAYLKIQDGCNAFCRYCIVPYARGRTRSLPPDEVIKRLIFLEKLGFKEIVLTGIHLGEYGKDLTPPISLTRLLYSIKNSNLKARLRLSSLNPSEITKELINLFISWPNLCPHLHISLQSGSKRILQKMGRNYTPELFKEIVSTLIQHFPLFAIGIDVIVGFPGETENDFEETYYLIKETPIAYCHIFSYSERPNTLAARYTEKVPLEIIQKRVNILRILDKEKRAKFFEKNKNKILNLLIETKNKNYFKGHTENYLLVRIPESERLKINTIVPVKIVYYKNGNIYGNIYGS